MKEEGRRRKTYFKGGKWFDTIIFAVSSRLDTESAWLTRTTAT